MPEHRLRRAKSVDCELPNVVQIDNLEAASAPRSFVPFCGLIAKTFQASKSDKPPLCACVCVRLRMPGDVVHRISPASPFHQHALFVEYQFVGFLAYIQAARSTYLSIQRLSPIVLIEYNNFASIIYLNKLKYMIFTSRSGTLSAYKYICILYIQHIH